MILGLKDAMPRNIQPVEYSGEEDLVFKEIQGNPIKKARTMANEKALFKWASKNLLMMTPKEAPHLIHSDHVR